MKKIILSLLIIGALFVVGCASGVDVEDLTDEQLDYVVAADERAADSNIAGEAFRVAAPARTKDSSGKEGASEKVNPKVPHTGAPIKITSTYGGCYEDEETITQVYDDASGYSLSRTLDRFLCRSETLYERRCVGDSYDIAFVKECEQGCHRDGELCWEDAPVVLERVACEEHEANARASYDEAYDNDGDCYMVDHEGLAIGYTPDCDDEDSSVAVTCLGDSFNASSSS